MRHAEFMRWIYGKNDEDYKTCPACKCEVYDPICDPSVERYYEEMRYCPYCGEDNFDEEEASKYAEEQARMAMEDRKVLEWNDEGQTRGFTPADAAKEEEEAIAMEEIAEAVKKGYYHGLTGNGMSWSLEVN